jgi:DNA helicase-2/ATP-dependent DNA helicase PcrA
VIALYDGNVPADMSAGSKDSIDEERRLLYVAMTRARRALHLYVPVRYYHRPNGTGDAHGYSKPSRFLTEQLQQLCRVSRPSEQLGQLHAAPGARRQIAVSIDALFD